MLIEHFSPVPAMLEAWQANVPYMALTDSKSPSLAFLKSELASLKKQKWKMSKAKLFHLHSSLCLLPICDVHTISWAKAGEWYFQIDYTLGSLRKNLKAFKKGGDGTHNAMYRNESKNELIFKIRLYLRLRPQF